MRYSFTLILLTLLGSVANTARAQQDTTKRAFGPLSEGQTLAVIHFDPDRADILSQDRTVLDTLHQTYVKLVGYTDNSSSDTHNSRLSVQRAHVVRDYLRSKGWQDSLFLDVDGLGSSHPLNDNGSAGKKSLNRRVEIIIQRPHVATLQDLFKDTASLVGKNIILHHVNFYPGRHIPLPEAYKPIQELLVIMRKHPTLRIGIQGYVCCNSGGFDGVDEETHLPDLSDQRAKFVYDFLVKNGVQKNRLSYKGFGSANKIFPEEKDESEAAANRRVEVKIISF